MNAIMMMNGMDEIKPLDRFKLKQNNHLTCEHKWYNLLHCQIKQTYIC